MFAIAALVIASAASSIATMIAELSNVVFVWTLNLGKSSPKPLQ